MFRQLYKTLANVNLLEQSFDQATYAMKILLTMFIHSKNALRLNNVDTSFNIFIEDKKINKVEREVRRKSLSHIAITGHDSINPTLILITIIHDIERIGDYTKNIFELSEKTASSLFYAGEKENEVLSIEESISNTLTKFSEPFSNMEIESAREIVKLLVDSQKKCDFIINQSIKEAENNSLSTSIHQLLIGVLYLRYIKRISAHLTNIATSFVNPYDRIGFEE